MLRHTLPSRTCRLLLVDKVDTVSESGARRLFICKAEPSEIRIGCALHSDDSDRADGDADMEFLPLRLYSICWNIEMGYYEHKTF